jgi:hypothetical protein
MKNATEKYIETRLIGSCKIDIYQVSSPANEVFSKLGFAARYAESQKLIANFTGWPTDDQIGQFIPTNKA